MDFVGLLLSAGRKLMKNFWAYQNIVTKFTAPLLWNAHNKGAFPAAPQLGQGQGSFSRKCVLR